MKNQESLRRILIFKLSESFPGGRAYLCADGCLCSDRNQAAEFWSIQFDYAVEENWIVRPACAELVPDEKVACPEPGPDFRLENHGSLYLVRPMTGAGKEWLRETAPEDAQFLGRAMAVEPRYVEDVCQAAQDAGLSII